jgi:putative glutamine amidotransferase
VTARPRILIPARFSESASALRFQAEVNARALVSAVFAAGGEPLTVHPHAPDSSGLDDGELAARFPFADGVLLPGGGDITPVLYGGLAHPKNYDMDREQDDFDVALARWSIGSGLPVLAICRGLQVVNVALGGTLAEPMPTPHRSATRLRIRPEGLLARILGPGPRDASCYHHQAICDLGSGLQACAWAPDGTIEAIERVETGPQWLLGLQWHPEDTVTADSGQRAIFAEFVRACTPDPFLDKR